MTKKALMNRCSGKKYFIQSFQSLKNNFSLLFKFLFHKITTSKEIQVEPKHIIFLDHVDVLAVLVKSKESKKESLFLPWNERNIKALKIPNISIIENDFFFPKKNYNDLLNGYKQLDYPNFDELYPY